MQIRHAIVKLAFVGFWGLVIGCSKSDDEYKGWDLPELSAEEGFSLTVPSFDIEAGTESQNCYFVEAPDLNGDGSAYYMSKVHMAKTPGSHHLNVFRVNTISGLDPANGRAVKLGQYDATVIEGFADYTSNPCWLSNNWSDWPLVANSQESDVENPYTVWEMPENVGIKITPGEKLMVQTHYVNYGEQISPYGVSVGINFHRYPADVTPIEMGSLFATQQNIRICQSSFRSRFSGTCKLPSGTFTIEALNGHFHSRGKEFSVYTWDGVSADQPPESSHLYTSDRWDDPPMATGINVKPPEGGGIWWNCDYQWEEPYQTSCDTVNDKDPQKEGDCCYTFGGNVDVGEHCNVFMYYYPRIDAQDVFCN